MRAREVAIRQRMRLLDVPTISLFDVLLDRAADIAARVRGRIPHWELLKLDGDGPENAWLSSIVKMISRRLMTVAV